jgi:glycosyltransferase involved in cell wall biosynthesis
LTARFADVLVADSQAIAKIWERLFCVSSTYIPYGAPIIDDIDKTRVEALGLQARTYVLVVARLIPENNVEMVLDALEMMRERCPAVIVGSASYNSSLESRLRDLDHGGHVRWLGHVNDQELLTQLWANCGAYVHGHSVGGTNPGLLQALGAGAPTIALDTEFNREVIELDEQLFASSSSDLVDRLEDLVGNAEKQRRFMEHGRDVVDKRYIWKDVSAAYLEALKDARRQRSADR